MDLGESWHKCCALACPAVWQQRVVLLQPGHSLVRNSSAPRQTQSVGCWYFIMKPLAGEASLWPERTKIESSYTYHCISIIHYLGLIIKYCGDRYSRFSLVRKRDEALACNKRWSSVQVLT